MGQKISIVGQIAEIEREIALRQSVYPGQVRAGKMKEEQAKMLMDRAHAIRETLYFCQKHQAEFRAYMDAKKAGQP